VITDLSGLSGGQFLAVNKSAYHGRITEPPPPHIPFSERASYPARLGNRVRPLIDGEPAFRRICEAVGAARYSVWVTVAFIRSGFLMPDGRSIFFDVLDEAVARGLDVHVLFWRPNSEATYVGAGTTLSGTEGDRDFLERRRSRFRVRWDRAHGAFCQHQKSWLIDAGELSETALSAVSISIRAPWRPRAMKAAAVSTMPMLRSPGRRRPTCITTLPNAGMRPVSAPPMMGYGPHNGQNNLAFPERLSQEQGASLVQIQRNIDAGLYRDGRPSPAAPSFEIANGESTIQEQYLAAIDDANRDFC
jgi:phosphatidylserine/phosphatidylglycerophosphate/cardiolipin synthase-like enzyme